MAVSGREQLLPTQTVDRNGKRTTVYRSPATTVTARTMPPVQQPVIEGLPPSVAARLKSSSTTLAEQREIVRDSFIGNLILESQIEQITIDRFIAELEPLTVRLLATLISSRELGYVNISSLRDRLNALQRYGKTVPDVFIRDYAMLTPLWDKQTNPKPFHLIFEGMLHMKRSANPGSSFLCITTDRALAEESALMQYGLAANTTEGAMFSDISVGDAYSYYMNGTKGLVLKNDMEELIRRRPQDIDLICDISISRGVIDAAAIEDLIDLSGTAALSPGAL